MTIYLFIFKLFFVGHILKMTSAAFFIVWAIVTLAFGEILKNIIGNLYVGLDSRGLRFALSEEAVRLADDGKMIISGPLGATGITKIATFGMGFALILFTLFVILNMIDSLCADIAS